MVSSGIAWVLVGIAILVWGSFIIPVKLKAVQEAQLHPLVFQTYMGLAIAPSSLIVWAWEKPSWTWWGFAGAGLWVMGNTCAIGAVKRLGIGTAQGIWAGGICVISFLWGFLARPLWADGTCTITDVPLAIIGLVVVVVGIVGLSVVSSAFAKQDNSGDKDTLETLIGDELPASEEPNPILSSEAGSKTTVSGPGTIPRSTSSGSLVSLGAVEFDPVKLETLSKPRLVGSVLAIITSLFGGSCLVPVKLAPDSIQAGYAVPFGIGTVVVSGGMCLVYTVLSKTCVLGSSAHKLDQLNWDLSPKVLLPCLGSGVLWNIGNLCSIVVANSSLGLTIGYPLMQSALVIGGIWGIVLYQELKGVKAITLFLGSASVICAGAVLLGMNGACKEDK